MMETNDQLGFKDKIHIVLTGPDGKVKDEREIGHEADKGHGVQKRNGIKRFSKMSSTSSIIINTSLS